MDHSLFFDLPTLVADRIVKLFVDSESFDQANSFASTVTKYSSDFTKGQVEKIIRHVVKAVKLRTALRLAP